MLWFLLSLIHAMVEEVLFWVKISKCKFWWFYTLWGLLNPKIKFLEFGLCDLCLRVRLCVYVSECVSVCVCVCYQRNTRTNCSRNMKFSILQLCHIQMLLETFYKDRTKTLYTGACKRILIKALILDLGLRVECHP